MTLKEREDRFVAKCRKDFKDLSFETEQLLRYGYSQAALELSPIAFYDGTEYQRELTLAALGAAHRNPRKTGEP